MGETTRFRFHVRVGLDPFGSSSALDQSGELRSLQISAEMYDSADVLSSFLDVDLGKSKLKRPV